MLSLSAQMYHVTVHVLSHWGNKTTDGPISRLLVSDHFFIASLRSTQVHATTILRMGVSKVEYGRTNIEGIKVCRVIQTSCLVLGYGDQRHRYRFVADEIAFPWNSATLWQVDDKA